MACPKLLFFVIGLTIVGYSHQSEPQLTMDQLIMNAAKTSTAFDFIQSSKTVLVELDIKYLKETWQDMEEAKKGKTEKRRRRALSRLKRKGIHGNRWTNGVVPYQMARYFKDSEKDLIRKALEQYHQHTCIRFKERTDEKNYLMFVDGGGCSSFVGMKGGEQEVTLGRGCRQLGVIMHEVGHAMGFHHEQTRPDRDDYVTIQQSNIPPNVYFNFQKYSYAVIKNWNIPYDYSSIMHYGATAFSYNGRPTIVAKQKKYQQTMGNRAGFSFRDIKLLNVMYQCAAQCPKKTCPGEAFQNKDCQCICPGSPTKVCGAGDDGRYDGAQATECKNKEDGCERWAERGYCTGQYEKFMNINCKKSCQLCPTQAPETAECEDKKENCEYWKERGHCDSEEWKDYMTENCPSACGKCSKEKECADLRNECSTWKSRGFCTYDVYKDFMLANCRETCDLCPGIMEGCEDLKDNCQSWAGRGFCQNTYVAYMRTNCPKSCKICSAEAKACTDKHQKCYVWAYVGECQRNAAWMKTNCKKSCNTCEGRMMNPMSDCVDMNNHCNKWSQQGECDKNPAYMHNYCKKSCNRCGAMGDYSSVAACKDSNKFCDDWSKLGECEKNPLYMHEQCKLSCKKCGGGAQSDAPVQQQTQQTKYNRNCRDNHRFCRSWSKMSECAKNPAYMNIMCRKSCGKC